MAALKCLAVFVVSQMIVNPRFRLRVPRSRVGLIDGTRAY